MSDDYFLILKENWSKWFCIDDIEKIKSIIDKITKVGFRDADEG